MQVNNVDLFPTRLFVFCRISLSLSVYQRFANISLKCLRGSAKPRPMEENMNEKRHQEVYLLINKIAYEEIDDEEYRVLKESLMAVTQDLLKKEWERVKLEARGKRK